MASSTQIAFRPTGQTITISVTTSASTGKQAPVRDGETDIGQFLIDNVGTSDVYLGYGGSAATAQANATTGDPTNAYPVRAGCREIVTLQGRAFFSAICASGSSTLHIVPGNGL